MDLVRRCFTSLFLPVIFMFLMPHAAALAAASEAGEAGSSAGEPGEKDEKEKDLPLEPARAIEFTTREATWLSLDVSPGGETLVFELLGDLYTLPIEGGEANRITQGMAFDSQPSYSGDGERIAFLSDRDGAENLWIARSDGSEPRQLSKDKSNEFASPAWTPDDRYVLVSRSGWGMGTFEVWMYHVDGGAGVQVTKAKPDPKTPRSQRHNALGVTASPDGRYLYYAQKNGGFQYNASFPLWQIARRDQITGIEDILTQAPGSAIRPLLSPDGTKLVYGTRYEARTGLRLRDLTTGEDRWLEYPVQRDDQESRFTRDLLPGYAFMPDGKEIVLSHGGRIQRVRLADGQARVIPFTAAVEQELGPRLHFPRRVEDGPIRARIIQGPTVSPDGNRLAFSALTHLYTMDLPDGRPQRVTRGEDREFQPAWSPDGRWLAYVTWSADGGHLWRARSDGRGAARQLSPAPAFYTDPSWSPDGERIVLLRAPTHERVEMPFDFGQAPGMDLVWIPAEGGPASLVIPARGMGRPHFSRESDRIYLYLSSGPFSDGGPNGLVSVRFDGTDRREHLKVTGPGYYFNEEPIPADDIRVSPDGRWALAHTGNQLYLAAVPPVGGSAPTVDISSPSVPLKKITDVGADYFDWADDGATLTWAVGSTVFRQPFDTISFAEKKEEEPADEDEEEAAGDEEAGAVGSGGEPADDAGETGEEKSAKEEGPGPVEEIEVVVEVPRKVPSGTLVLRGVTAVTMRGDEVLRDAEIVVENARISAVGRSGGVTVPEGARVLELEGRTVVPGFIDTHAHWFEIRRGVLDVQNWSFLANLAYGVTAGLDVQTATNDMFAYQDLADAGAILGPRAYSTGPGIFSDNAFKSMEEAKGVISKYKKHYGARNLKSYIVGNRKQRQWVAQASKELEMMPTTEGALDLKLDLTHAIDGFSGNEHAFPIVPLYDDVVQLVARSGLGYTPTLLVNYGGPFAENHSDVTEEAHDDPKLRRFTPHSIIDSKTKRLQWFREDEHSFQDTAAQAGKIISAGGRVGIGSHGQLQGLGYHWEMWALASGGLTPFEVLRAATLHGAEIIGLSQDLGSIEPGKLADLVILGENPLEDIRNTNTVEYVIKNGELFEGDTLDQIWPEEKELAPLWWWDDDPLPDRAGLPER